SAGADSCALRNGRTARTDLLHRTDAIRFASRNLRDDAVGVRPRRSRPNGRRRLVASVRYDRPSHPEGRTRNRNGYGIYVRGEEPEPGGNSCGSGNGRTYNIVDQAPRRWVLPSWQRGGPTGSDYRLCRNI